MQNLEKFNLPKNFRGRSPFLVQLWWICQILLFNLSPQFMYGWRVWLLTLFGAKIGKKVLIRPSVKITYPWHLKLGDYVWIGDEVVLYNLGEIAIGSNSVISQRSYLCAGSHDYKVPHFPICASPILIGCEVWIATDVYVGPAVKIGDGAVIGARSSVFKDMPNKMLCYGYPCKPVRYRTL
jgi:putative colanic acid biosynthesis acetyltransferase WcaF